MGNKAKFSYFIFSTLFLSLLFFSTLPFTTSQKLIHETCKNCSKGNPNINFNFCTTSLQAAPASRCAALWGLGVISIQQVRYNVTDTRCFVKQLLKGDTKLDPYVKACLEDCFELYSDGLASMKQAMQYYKAKRFLDANVVITSVMDAAMTCEYGFKEKKGIVSPLTKRNHDTFELSAIVLSIMNMLEATTSS